MLRERAEQEHLQDTRITVRCPRLKTLLVHVSPRLSQASPRFYDMPCKRRGDPWMPIKKEVMPLLRDLEKLWVQLSVTAKMLKIMNGVKLNLITLPQSPHHTLSVFGRVRGGERNTAV